jgi:hypothetical protein
MAGKIAMVTLTTGKGIVPKGVKAMITAMAIISPVTASILVFSLLIALLLDIFSSLLAICLYHFTTEGHKNQEATQRAGGKLHFRLISIHIKTPRPISWQGDLFVLLLD